MISAMTGNLPLDQIPLLLDKFIYAFIAEITRYWIGTRESIYCILYCNSLIVNVVFVNVE